MNLDLIIGILEIILIATTPLVFAAIGELVTEKSGVLNLGVEGMMLVGAVSAFVTLVISGSYFLAFLISIFSGVLMSGLFAILVLYLMTNQIATGLALTIFGIGLSSMIGKKYIGTPIDGLSPWFFVIISFVSSIDKVVCVTNAILSSTLNLRVFKSSTVSTKSISPVGN